MAREEIGKRGGFIALIAVLAIMVILLGVVALVVVNALRKVAVGHVYAGDDHSDCAAAWACTCDFCGRAECWKLR